MKFSTIIGAFALLIFTSCKAGLETSKDSYRSGAQKSGAIKLMSEDCIDPPAGSLLSGVNMMACNGEFMSGTLDLSNLLPENIRSGVTIGSIVGSMLGLPTAYKATAGDPDVSSAVDLTASSPLISMTTDTNECHSRLSDGLAIRNRGENVILYDNKFEFFIICNRTSWDMARATWDPSGGVTGNWIDHDTGDADIDPLWTRATSTNSAGNAHFEHAVSLGLQVLPDNSLEGIYFQSSGATHENGLFMVQATNVATLTSASVQDAGVVAKNWIVANDTTKPETYIGYSSADFTIHKGKKYMAHSYDTGYTLGVVIQSYTDLSTTTADSPEKIFPNLLHGYIKSDGENFYLMAYDTQDHVWKMAKSTSVSTLSWNNAVDLKLRDMFGSTAGWNEVPAGTYNKFNRVPAVFDFEIYNNEFYFFYRAGEFNTKTPADAGAPRGIGVVKMSKI